MCASVELTGLEGGFYFFWGGVPAGGTWPAGVIFSQHMVKLCWIEVRELSSKRQPVGLDTHMHKMGN